MTVIFQIPGADERATIVGNQLGGDILEAGLAGKSGFDIGEKGFQRIAIFHREGLDDAVLQGNHGGTDNAAFDFQIDLRINVGGHFFEDTFFDLRRHRLDRCQIHGQAD